ncbi:hypothetical protein B0O99DRAFT_601165 [Bisporella sp. PMI_857]|nr:hypothetical protein B0O99DRAFT_601165 [Bisporella sp. PMI_857]
MPLLQYRYVRSQVIVVPNAASLFSMHSHRTEISDDKVSVASAKEPVLVKEAQGTVISKKRRPTAVVEETQESLMVESDKAEGDEDDEDEYLVEAITSHRVDTTGKIEYKVKWEGYEKESDKTWEPEVNLETVPEILKEYLTKVGGKDKILEQWTQKKAAKGKGKKRGRASTTSVAVGTPAKKGRRNGSNPTSSTPPPGIGDIKFKPPTGSWESEVVGIDACKGSAGAVIVYLIWKGGQRSQHPLAQVYKRCPQKYTIGHNKLQY